MLLTFFMSLPDSSFAISAWAVENLIFYLKVDEFRLLEGEKQQNMAKQLIDTYVANGAPFQLNLEMSTRESIMTKMKKGEITPTILDAAEKHCLYLLRYSVFPLWKASGSYRDLLKKHKVSDLLELRRGKTLTSFSSSRSHTGELASSGDDIGLEHV